MDSSLHRNPRNDVRPRCLIRDVSSENSPVDKPGTRCSFRVFGALATFPRRTAQTESGTTRRRLEGRKCQSTQSIPVSRSPSLERHAYVVANASRGAASQGKLNCSSLQPLPAASSIHNSLGYIHLAQLRLAGRLPDRIPNQSRKAPLFGVILPEIASSRGRSKQKAKNFPTSCIPPPRPIHCCTDLTAAPSSRAQVLSH